MSNIVPGSTPFGGWGSIKLRRLSMARVRITVSGGVSPCGATRSRGSATCAANEV